MKELTKEQAEFLRRKQTVLERGLYAPIPHALYQKELPRLQEIYGKTDARDAIFIYTYLHAYVNGQTSNSAYLWAFPNVDQIRNDTGIHGDRIKPLDRKSTRLNSSHVAISYAVFCLKKKKIE